MKSLPLTPEQQARLQAELRDSDNVQVYRRAAALLAIHQGRAVAQVAALLGVTRQTVYNWLSTYTPANGDLNLADAPRSGRPSLWTDAMDRLLEETLATSPREAGYTTLNWTAGLLAERLVLCGSPKVSGETLRRRLRRLGYVWKQGRFARPDEAYQLPAATEALPAGAERAASHNSAFTA
jgi:transposase